MRPLLLALFLAFIPSLAPAGETEQTPVIQLTVTPARQITPALKYTLLPNLADRIHGNAATLYATFTEEKPENPLTNESLLKQTNDWRDMDSASLPREQVTKFIADHFQTQLDLLDKAARHTTCDWEYPLEKGMNMMLPAIGRYRSLGNILSLRIRIAGLEGRYADAVHDLQTGFALAQHVGKGQCLINSLVAIAIEAVMLNEVERLAQSPNAPNFYWALASLPKYLIGLQPAMEFERKSLYYTSPYLLELDNGKFAPDEDPIISEQKLATALFALGQAISPDLQARKQPTDIFMQNVHNWTEHDRAKALDALLATGIPRSKAEAIPISQIVGWYWLQQYQQLADDQIKWGMLPYWQVHKNLTAWERTFKAQRAQSPSFVLMMIIPTFQHYVIAAKPERAIAVLQTIESIRDYAATHDGKLPADLDSLALPAPADPFTGKPLAYHVSGSTFTLESQIPDDVPAKDGLKYQITMKLK